MKFNLSDFGKHKCFAPLSLTRPIACLRMGIHTNLERYKLLLPDALIGFETETYLSEKYAPLECDFSINSCVIPNPEFIAAILHLEDNQSLYQNELLLAKKGNGQNKIVYLGKKLIIIDERWDLFMMNNEVLELDFHYLTSQRKSMELSDSNLLIGPSENLFIEEGATIEGCTLNTSTGVIYIGKHAEIMEGSMVRGGLALCESATIKMGSKIYGATTIGPFCKVGGEINNVIFQSFSNKGHDGFLGNSIIGEWCNLGADTNTSNLKNNYSNIRTYSYKEAKEVNTGHQFIGLSMGDFSKCAINTMFNTATVVGVSCNIFTGGFPSKHIPSFSWVHHSETTFNKLEKVFESANNMMSRRGRSLQDEDKNILKELSIHRP
jgi:UDP-N-acetylglucosamine diphosphorylase/glucosamine-1-phosphate N-acetyltransferase